MMEEFNLMLSTLLKRLNTYFIFACMCLNIHRFCLVVTFCGIIHYQTEYVLHVCKFVFQGSRIIKFQMVVCESKVSQKRIFFACLVCCGIWNTLFIFFGMHAKTLIECVREI